MDLTEVGEGDAQAFTVGRPVERGDFVELGYRQDVKSTCAHGL